MASQAEAIPQLGRTSYRPKIFHARRESEDRSKSDPPLSCARSKDLGERNSTTPFSASPSSIFGLYSIPEVDIELMFSCKSLSIGNPKSPKMTPKKGIIAATISGPQVHQDFSAHDNQHVQRETITQSSINPNAQLRIINSQLRDHNANLHIINSQLRDHNANLQINAATIIQKYARAMIIKSKFFDMLLDLFGFKNDTHITMTVDHNTQSRVAKCTDSIIIQINDIMASSAPRKIPPFYTCCPENFPKQYSTATQIVIYAITQVGGDGIGRRSWLLLETECLEPMTALEKGVILAKFISTCEAEVAALVGALKEAMFVLEILRDLGHEFENVHGYTDSKSGYETIMNPGVTKRTAHFERWLYWARELFLNKKLLLNHIRDEDMMADSLSKVTDRAKFLKCRNAQLNLPA